jgi:hypothetical protein
MEWRFESFLIYVKKITILLKNTRAIISSRVEFFFKYKFLDSLFIYYLLRKNMVIVIARGGEWNILLIKFFVITHQTGRLYATFQRRPFHKATNKHPLRIRVSAALTTLQSTHTRLIVLAAAAYPTTSSGRVKLEESAW